MATFNPPTDAGFAGFWRRVAALAFDSYFLCFLFLLIYVMLPIPLEILLPAGLLGAAAYLIAMECSPLQATVGKLLAGIFVTDTDGGRISPLRSVGRTASKWVLQIIPLVNLSVVLAAFTARKQTPYDMVAGTLVKRGDGASAGRAIGVVVAAIAIGIASASILGPGAAKKLQSGAAIPQDKSAYVGEWRSKTMGLRITRDGSVVYKRIEGGSIMSGNGPMRRFEGDNFVVGIPYVSTTFEVSKPPYQEGGQWKMVVDGVELTKAPEPGQPAPEVPRPAQMQQSSAPQAATKPLAMSTPAPEKPAPAPVPSPAPVALPVAASEPVSAPSVMKTAEAKQPVAAPAPAPAPRPPKVARTDPPAPTQTMGAMAAKPPCVYESVMTDGEIANCRGPVIAVMPVRADSQAQAPIPQSHVARATCVYKPVMTNEEIDLCRN